MKTGAVQEVAPTAVLDGLKTALAMLEVIAHGGAYPADEYWEQVYRLRAIVDAAEDKG